MSDLDPKKAADFVRGFTGKEGKGQKRKKKVVPSGVDKGFDDNYEKQMKDDSFFDPENEKKRYEAFKKKKAEAEAKKKSMMAMKKGS
jgi:hypothetical protein